jgi:hypothetical protein
VLAHEIRINFQYDVEQKTGQKGRVEFFCKFVQVSQVFACEFFAKKLQSARA